MIVEKWRGIRLTKARHLVAPSHGSAETISLKAFTEIKYEEEAKMILKRKMSKEVMIKSCA